jgi:hypothetical protein
VPVPGQVGDCRIFIVDPGTGAVSVAPAHWNSR